MNAEHYAKLREGVTAWNEWRTENPDIIPDFFSADLRGLNLVGVNLSGADLSLAYMGGTKLMGADLSGANLSGTCVSMENLLWANLTNAIMCFRGRLYSLQPLER